MSDAATNDACQSEARLSGDLSPDAGFHEELERTSRLVQPVDTLVRSDTAFALWRLPKGKPALVLQRDGLDSLFPNLAAVAGEGFLLAPFAEDRGHPVVLVREDERHEGFEAIHEALCEKARNLQFAGLAAQSFAVPNLEELERRLFDAAPDSGYEGALQVFLRDLHEGRFKKLVLSRAQNIPGSWAAARLFAGACLRYPDALVSLVHGRCGTWLGASPEILLEGEGNAWRTMALAGTRKRETPGPWDEKNLHEQAYVSAYLRKTLAGLSDITSETGPVTMSAGTVEHLRTDFAFTPKEGVSQARLVMALHPTPAVCGLPKEAAMERILTVESLDRRYYSGFLGPWRKDAARLYVNLRCMKLHAGGARLFAGGGILPESTLQSEWRETCHKMRTMLALLGR